MAESAKCPSCGGPMKSDSEWLWLAPEGFCNYQRVCSKGCAQAVLVPADFNAVRADIGAGVLDWHPGMRHDQADAEQIRIRWLSSEEMKGGRYADVD